jgi:acetoin utilization deacetylase AcuC-like enzyme
VHHGDGTQELFLDSPNVLVFSVHRYDHGTF